MSGGDWHWINRADGSLKSIEAWLGAFVVALMTITLGIAVVSALIGAVPSREFGTAAVCATIAVGWLCFDIRHLYWTWSCLRRGDRPLAPAVAMRQARPAAPLRPLVAIWWLAHFAMGVVFILVSEQLANERPTELHPASRVVFYAIVFGFAFAYTLAAHGYLLMMVSAVAPRHEWIAAVWRWRLAIDLGFVVLSSLITFPAGKPAH